MQELIIFIVIIVVLAPFLFVTNRRNKKQINMRKKRSFMDSHLDKKKESSN
jgi:preprotein translocase subunit YajC